MDSGCIDHLLNLRCGVDRDNFDVWMALREHPKDLICESLPYGLHRLEVKKNSSKTINPNEQAFCLRSRDELVVAILRKPDGYHGFCKAVIVST